MSPRRTSVLRPDATFSERRIFSNSSLLRSAEMLSSQPALLRIAASSSCVMAKGFSGFERVSDGPDHTPLQVFASLERVHDLTRERIGSDGVDREVPPRQIFLQAIS